MSRSYKKNIRVTDGRAHTTKYVKNLANRKVRRSAFSTANFFLYLSATAFTIKRRMHASSDV